MESLRHKITQLLTGIRKRRKATKMIHHIRREALVESPDESFCDSGIINEDGVNLLQAYAAFANGRSPRNPNADIPSDIFGKLPQEFRRAWRNVPENDMERILSCLKPATKTATKNSELSRPARSPARPNNSNTNNTKRNIYFATTDTDDGYETEGSFDQDQYYDTQDDDDNNGNVLEMNVNAAKAKPRASNGILKKLPAKTSLPQGDIRRMLATNEITACFDNAGNKQGYFIRAVSDRKVNMVKE